MIPGVGDDAAGATDEASPPDSPTDEGGARTVGLQPTAPINVAGTANAASTDDSSSAASSVAASVPVPSAASLLALGAAGSEPVSEQTLAEREEALSALLAASELEHAELSERMMRVYEAQAEKLVMLRQMEKTLSSQAGQCACTPPPRCTAADSSASMGTVRSSALFGCGHYLTHRARVCHDCCACVLFLQARC